MARTFAFVAAALACASAVLAVSEYHAAKCMSAATGCTREDADTAKYWCREGRATHDQDPCCKRAACNYCTYRRHHDVCSNSHMIANCFNWNPEYICQDGHTTHGENRGHHDSSSNDPVETGNQPQPEEPTNNFHSSHWAGCVTHGSGDKVVMSMENRGHGAWNNVDWGHGLKGVQYTANHFHDAGYDVITVPFTVPKDGVYWITLHSIAPHHTEHNDAWLMFPNNLKVTNGWSAFWSSGWLKAYQNCHDCNYIWNVDHHPHHFETTWLTAGQVYEVRISGRSAQYYIDRIFAIRCPSGSCNPYDLEGQTKDRTPSTCQ